MVNEFIEITLFQFLEIVREFYPKATIHVHTDYGNRATWYALQKDALTADNILAKVVMSEYPCITVFMPDAEYGSCHYTLDSVRAALKKCSEAWAKKNELANESDRISKDYSNALANLRTLAGMGYVSMQQAYLELIDLAGVYTARRKRILEESKAFALETSVSYKE